ncbi:methyl-CpG-binding domain protein 2-like [Brevipalpus obovatus]|uniref:methyl-CpG-binding domain protein 2-like n=1 Tax=Brevipalpus obovatus TaxID=246614 RepID=UPI003D9DB4AD
MNMRMENLPKGWRREEVMRPSGLSTGKTEVFYISPNGMKIKSKRQLQRCLGDGYDLTAFDFRTGKINPHLLRQAKHHRSHDRGHLRCGDISVSPPLRRTASIFKQKVTVVRSQREGKTKPELKHIPQDKPKQLFWEKRLEKLRATVVGHEDQNYSLPKNIVPAGPDIGPETALRSLSTALHLHSGQVTGQTDSKNLAKSIPIYFNSNQPLIHTILISDEDIRRQEERVNLCRLKLSKMINELELSS